MDLLPIHTRRLVLRQFTIEDLAVFQAYRADSELARYQDWEPMSDADARMFLSRQSQQRLGAEGQWLQVAITRSDTGQVIGDLGLCVRDEQAGVVEIGFTLASSTQRQGYATEAVTGVLDALLAGERVHSVVAVTDARNAAAIALLRRLEFEQEGTAEAVFRGAPCQEHHFRRTNTARADGSQARDQLFHAAVSAIDAGDIAEVERLVAAHPALVRDRLEAPGAWLRDQVGNALEGFFQRPYLLWFVAEDPVRTGRLPANIADIARAIIRAARLAGAETLQEQLDDALRLVSWSWIARDCHVQIDLLDVLVDAGASPDGNPDNAIVNSNFAAAAHLVERGARLTLATALCLGRWGDARSLGGAADARERQFAFVLAALKGKAEALTAVIALGVDLNAPCTDLYPHATALHHAVHSGSLEAVKVLVEAGAGLNAKDTVYGGTPLDWAEYGKQAEIADYLRPRPR